ncbi:Glucose-methanol-choline oxidoreductase [Penicillium italicum]|uniref:Glucose-methanol-choline oxidoreductase n=1 Tax=Penicillium italicum TaxID=40296 RepID=A0A0A2KZZ8_PENIT|nr:Glucose-methanol-choline oxidoreductase [Penicillium italicum]
MISRFTVVGSSFGIPGKNATFDYIVVGGGNAGLAIAARLVEGQSGSVAVVEAGTFYEIGNGNLSQVPGLDNNYISKPPDDWQPLTDWGYVTSPQKDALDVEMHYARGKCLGGSSARNYMIYQRGTNASYQRWADLVGDESYTFDRMLPYFERSVCFTPPNEELRFTNSSPLYDVSVMGDCQGPLSISYSNYAFSFASWATKGLIALGIQPIDGFLSGSLLGQSYVISTINATTMNRDSSETSFMRRVLEYPNFAVYSLSMAKKIIFSPDNKNKNGKKATGVVVDTQGAQYVLTATKEVIVSAGAFASPQLLMVSGVGPAAHLEKHGIPVVADRPGVGQNMQDHEHASGMLTNPSNDVLGWEKFPEPVRNSTLSAETRRTLDQYPADWPEVEYLAIAGYLGYQNISGGSDPHDGFNYVTMGVALGMPQSRGTVTLASADNSVRPIIDPRYFSNWIDVEVAVAGYKRAREFFHTAAVRPFLLDGQEAFPGPSVSSTDAELEQIIKQTFLTIFHASCTCSMGRADGPMAVVDSKARVYGVSGLRVVDASAFPILPPGHPMGTVYALAEKIASDILSSA